MINHLAQVSIDLHPGHGSIVVDDEDIADKVSSVDIHGDGQSVPSVVLTLRAEAKVEGEAYIYIARPVEMKDVADFAISLLNGIDVQQLEADALSRQGWGEDGVTATIINMIKEAFQNAADQS